MCVLRLFGSVIFSFQNNRFLTSNKIQYAFLNIKNKIKMVIIIYLFIDAKESNFQAEYLNNVCLIYIYRLFLDISPIVIWNLRIILEIKYYIKINL